MRKSLVLLVLAVFILALTGCATAVKEKVIIQEVIVEKPVEVIKYVDRAVPTPALNVRDSINSGGDIRIEGNVNHSGTVISSSSFVGVSSGISSSYTSTTISGKTNMSNESYSEIKESGFIDAKTSPLSTFSIDVDTASYSNVRRMIMTQGKLPPKDSVRIEEMVNYFF